MVSWQPLTLIEARGFIEYTVTLYIDAHQTLSMRVPMNQSSTIFTGVNPTQTISMVSIGIEYPTTGMRGPVAIKVMSNVSPQASQQISSSGLTLVAVTLIAAAVLVL